MTPDHSLTLLWKMETAFDQYDSDYLQSLIHLNNELSPLAELMLKMTNDEISDGISFGKELFVSISDPLLRTCIHHWIIAGIDSLYLPTERTQWIRQWRYIDTNHHPWIRYIRKYQLAVGLYFDSMLRDSLALFEQLAEEAKALNYLKGIEKCYFHIGLIYRCINQTEKARFYFDETLRVAKDRNSLRQINKANEAKKSLELSHWHINPLLRDIEQFLKQGQFRKARKLLLHSLRIRRAEGLSRAAQSETMYMALVSLAFGNEERFSSIYKACILDNVIKEKTISFAIEIGLNLPPTYIEELSFLRQILGITATTTLASAHFFGLNLNKVKDSDAVKVIQKLTQNMMGLTKEELCTDLWNYNYDPIIHDPKIYNLIYRVKKVFQCKDLIVATNGYYRINPKYLST